MSTAIVYVDEAGTPDSHREPLAPESGETPAFTLAAVAMPISAWRDSDRNYLRLKRQFFPDMMGKPKKRDEEVEIKGRDLTSPRQKTSSRRQEFNRRALDLIQRFGASAFGVTFLKNPTTPVSSRSIYGIALQVLVERISLYVAEHPVYDNALLICDSRMKGPNGLDTEVARSHMSYIFGHEYGRTFTNIVEAPLFADSRFTVGLQLADLLAANLYTNHYHHYLRDLPGALNYSHVRRWWPVLDRLQYKSARLVDGYPVFGYRVIDHRKQSSGGAAA